MTPARWLTAGLAVIALAAAGCSSGPVISPKTIGKSDRLCKDLAVFQTQAVALEAASNANDLVSVKADVPPTVTDLTQLNTDAANLPDKVGGHLVKADLAVALSTYQTLAQAIAGVDPTNPQAFAAAIASVQNSEGGAFTASTGRLDAYTKSVCGLVVSNPTTTTPSAAGPTAAPTTTSTTAAATAGTGTTSTTGASSTTTP